MHRTESVGCGRDAQTRMGEVFMVVDFCWLSIWHNKQHLVFINLKAVRQAREEDLRKAELKIRYYSGESDDLVKVKLWDTENGRVN